MHALVISNCQVKFPVVLCVAHDTISVPQNVAPLRGEKMASKHAVDCQKWDIGCSIQIFQTRFRSATASLRHMYAAKSFTSFRVYKVAYSGVGACEAGTWNCDWRLLWCCFLLACNVRVHKRAPSLILLWRCSCYFCIFILLLWQQQHTCI